MAFTLTTTIRPDVTVRDGTLITLRSPRGATAVVYPALGFNCFHWSVPSPEGTLQLLFQDPELFPNGRPTRSGIPILFPYPNRIENARFSWEGKEYHLPKNDNIQKNNIHGFACRSAFRVIDQGCDKASAWVTGEFHLFKDFPECREYWPVDAVLKLTYRLTEDSLAMGAEVRNPDNKPLPFGLGYHPYFQLPFLSGLDAEDCSLSCPASSYWRLNECLPDGRKIPVDPARDLNRLRLLRGFQVDDILTDLPKFTPGPDGLLERGRVVGAKKHALALRCDAAWRDMVVFTPGARTSVCIEPYTCVTNAINLQAQGFDTGLLVLKPGEVHRSQFVMRVEPMDQFKESK